MFQLRFTPDFARQKDSLLRQRTIPAVPIPSHLRDDLFGLHHSDSAASENLWLESVRVVRPLLYKVAVISLFSSACAALSTLAAMRLLRTGLDMRSMWMLSAIYFAMNCGAQFAIYHAGRLRCWVGLGVESHLVGLISRKLLRLSAVAAARQSSGNLKTLVTSDVKNVGQFIDNAARNLLPALTGLAVTSPLLVYFAGWPGVIGLVIMAAGLPLSALLNRISAHFQTRSQAELDRLTSLVGEWVKNIRLIRYLCWDEAFQVDVAAGMRRFMTVSVVQHFMACLIFGLGISWWMISTTGVVLMAGWLNQPLGVAGFFGSLWLLTFLAGYFTHLPNTIRLYALATPSAVRIKRLLGEPEQADLLKPACGLAADAVPIKLIFNDVTFQYSDGKPVVRNLSLEVSLDRQLAIIGEVGSGKTTLLKLFCGELPPTTGWIQVEFANGRICDLWTQDVYAIFRRHIAYVPQEAFVSSDLLHMNISLHDDGDRSDILAAAYWAELEADLAALPRGISEEIGESGVNLSGGQRQRLNLARAFFANRACMVLDDTFSAVDTKTEVNLMERLVNRAGGFVLVTHRTGELLRVGEVVVMKEGSIVERGDPKALARQDDSHLLRVLRAYESETSDV